LSSVKICSNYLSRFWRIAGFKQKSVRSYWIFLDKLLSWHQQSIEEQSTPRFGTLYVIGESHSLSHMESVVRYNEQDLQCVAEWISGCKQWHLGNEKVTNTNTNLKRHGATTARVNNFAIYWRN